MKLFSLKKMKVEELYLLKFIPNELKRNIAFYMAAYSLKLNFPRLYKTQLFNPNDAYKCYVLYLSYIEEYRKDSLIVWCVYYRNGEMCDFFQITKNAHYIGV